MIAVEEEEKVLALLENFDLIVNLICAKISCFFWSEHFGVFIKIELKASKCYENSFSLKLRSVPLLDSLS